ncbi:BolA family protein [Woeseia oceani]|uniref:Cell division protein BolA n=1 Tax=Woeseia oceani TaxID=1548547 RepID=A0A193LG89_9GAMM|nr:BolA family protein [Woeseia oceani]ANO51478.1 cell division protein BolA [Woeseia oceani]
MSTSRINEIEALLREAFEPQELLVKDQSHLHIGHAGAKDGRGHFDVKIIAAGFEGRSQLQRHRMVYDALGVLMQTDIHALRIQAKTPDER